MMRLRGTVYIYPKGCEPGHIPTMLRFVKEYAAKNASEFREQVWDEYPNPIVQIDFGPIGEPWSLTPPPRWKAGGRG